MCAQLTFWGTLGTPGSPCLRCLSIFICALSCVLLWHCSSAAWWRQRSLRPLCPVLGESSSPLTIALSCHLIILVLHSLTSASILSAALLASVQPSVFAAWVLSFLHSLWLLSSSVVLTQWGPRHRPAAAVFPAWTDLSPQSLIPVRSRLCWYSEPLCCRLSFSLFYCSMFPHKSALSDPVPPVQPTNAQLTPTMMRFKTSLCSVSALPKPLWVTDKQ